MDPKIKFNQDTIELLKKNMDEKSVKCMDDEINLLDKSLIQKHKHNTLKFIHQYYTEKHNWTIYHSRFRKSLLKYINDNKMNYEECSAPLKAFLSWDLKNRSNDKAFYIARKYNPKALDELIKINDVSFEKVNELTSKLKIKDMVEVGTNTDKDKSNRYCSLEKYCKNEISVQTEPIREIINDYVPPFDEPEDISDCYFTYTDIIYNKKLEEENKKLKEEIKALQIRLYKDDSGCDTSDSDDEPESDDPDY